jgi:putative spermidine/putrescine transport system permease protein
MAWLVVAYLGSLAVLLLSSLWTVNSFTGQTVRALSLRNFQTIFSEPVYREVLGRSIAVAAVVTVVDVVIAFPMALYIAKIASPRARHWLVIAILTPLWASYLVKAYAWRVMLANDGPLDWIFGGHGPGYGLTATVIVLSYLWLPYMILPIVAGFDRLPPSLLEASADLGARAGRTMRSVVLPILVPSIVAGSIFTFSLSLGDYITVQIVGGKSQLIGNLVAINVGNNLPFAAALATLPIVVMVGYLLAVRRTGALDHL